MATFMELLSTTPCADLFNLGRTHLPPVTKIMLVLRQQQFLLSYKYLSLCRPPTAYIIRLAALPAEELHASAQLVVPSAADESCSFA